MPQHDIEFLFRLVELKSGFGSGNVDGDRQNLLRVFARLERFDPRDRRIDCRADRAKNTCDRRSDIEKIAVAIEKAFHLIVGIFRHALMGDDVGVLVGVRRLDSRRESIADGESILVLEQDAGEFRNRRIGQAATHRHDLLHTKDPLREA